MDYSSNLWDLSSGLPQQLQPIDDTDFLTLLSKQLNPHSNLQLPLQQQQQSAGLLHDASPLLTEESSSPSPPAQTRRGLSDPVLATVSAKSNTSVNQNNPSTTNDEMGKRKHRPVDEDDDDDSDLDGQPHHKSAKESGRKPSTTKRKSGGADEVRLQKRKEQNRAAQRAFRERKEKHVKDLEDQLTAMEEKSAGQAQENENLRDLLGRLQNENLMLKQSAFTFNMQRSAAANPNNNNSNTTSASSNTNATARTTPSTLPSPIESSKSASSPGSVRNDVNQFTNGTFTPLLNFGALGSSSSGSNNNSSGNGMGNNISPASLGDMPLSFFSPPPPASMQLEPSPYTTIASNPMYTSYTDQTAWDQFFANAALDPSWSSIGDLPGSNNASGSGSNGSPGSNGQTTASDNNRSSPGNMEDLFSATGNFSDLVAFSGFSPTNSFIAPNSSNGVNGSISPVARSSTVTATQPSNYAFSLASRDSTAPSFTAPPPAPRSSSPCGGAEPDEPPQPSSTNYRPIHSMSIKPAKGNSPPAAQEAPFIPLRCPSTSQEVQAIIEASPITTLGGAMDHPPPGSTGYALSEAKKLKLKEVWQTIKNHPQFDECDMDELCRELSQKVRWDGSMPVMDANEKPCEELIKTVLKTAQDLKGRKQSNAGLPRQPASGNTTPQAGNSGSSLASAPKTNFGALTTMPAPLSMTAEEALQEALKVGQSFDPAHLAVKNFVESFSGPGAYNFTSGAFESAPSAPQQQQPPQSASATTFPHVGSLMSVATSNDNNAQQQQRTQNHWSTMLLDAPSPNTQFMNMVTSMVGGSNVNPASAAPPTDNTMEGLLTATGMASSHPDFFFSMPGQSQ